MRRKNIDPWRQQRRRFARGYLVAAAGLLVIFLLFIVAHYRHPGLPLPSKQVVKEVSAVRASADALNLTEEMLSASSVTRQLGDQMTLAKSYVVMAKEYNNLEFAWELSVQIRACQELMSKAATRGYPLTLLEAEPVMQELALLLYQAKELHFDSATMIMRLKAQIQGLEEKINAAMLQSTTFGQLAAEAVPKGLYCLGSRLTMEWATDPDLRSRVARQIHSPKLTDNSLYHFCIFSDNVLATSVVVNSTVLNAEHPEKHVFHLVTDKVNFGAMQAWFGMNDYSGATVEVKDIDSFTWLNASYVPVMKQLQDAETQSYYFKGTQDPKSAVKFRNPKYLSMLNHLRFYIPEVYPALKKVVFLDDDVVAQKDLTLLFSLNLNGNVNGAVETCLETFHRYHKYLNFSHPKIRANFDPDACGWAFGMNVFDLVAWRKANVTNRYHYWQEQNVDRTLWKLGTLPPGLLTFYGLTEPLDREWHILGLGYDPNVDPQVIESGAVVHYNGNMKPWLKLAMSSYKPLWEKTYNCACTRGALEQSNHFSHSRLPIGSAQGPTAHNQVFKSEGCSIMCDNMGSSKQNVSTDMSRCGEVRVLGTQWELG